MKQVSHLYAMTYKDVACQVTATDGVVILPSISSLPEYKLGSNYLVSAPIGAYVLKSETVNNGSVLSQEALFTYTHNYVSVVASDNSLLATVNGGSLSTTAFTAPTGSIIYSEYEVTLRPEKVEIAKGSTLSNITLSVPDLTIGDSFLVQDSGQLKQVAVTGFSNTANISASWAITEISASKNLTNLVKVIYDGFNFVAIQGGGQSSNKLYSSADGDVWNEVTLPEMSLWSDISFSNGKYVLVSASSNIVLHSTNLSIWFKAYLPVNANWQSISQGNGKFVITGNSTDIGTYSDTAVNWQKSIMPAAGNWQSVAYGNGKFIAVLSSSAQNKVYAYSNDGVTWIKGSLPYVTANAFVKYENNLFFIVLKNSKKLLVSQDGASWGIVDLPTKANWVDISYGNGQYILIANGVNAILTSTDGSAWSQEVPDITLPQISLSSICFGDNKFLAIASNSDKILTRTVKSTVFSNVTFDTALSTVPSWLIRSGREFKISGSLGEVTPDSISYSYDLTTLTINYYLATVSLSTYSTIQLLKNDSVSSIKVRFLTTKDAGIDYIAPLASTVYFSDGEAWYSIGSGSTAPSNLEARVNQLSTAVDAIAIALSNLI